MENQDYIQREIDARAKAEMDARSILDAAAAENRDVTPEEEERFDRFVAESDRRKATIDKLVRMAEVSAEVRNYPGLFEAATAQTEPVRVSDAERIQNAVRSAYMGQSTPPRDFAQRALAKFSDSSASVAEPEFSSRVAFYARTLNPTVSVSTVINSTSGESVTLPKMTADPTSYTPGEGTAITPADPTLSTATLTVVSYKTLTLVSQELAQDNAINLMDIIARSAGRSLGLALGTALTTGTSGFITLGTNGGTATSGNSPFFKSDDLIDLFYSAPVPYRAVGSWMVSTTALAKVRKFATTTGEYLWQPSLQVGEPDSFFGRPIYENPAMAAVASVSKSVAFGDFSAYIVKSMPLRVDVSRDYLFNTDQIAVKVVHRIGGTLPDTAAIRYLVNH